MKAGKLRDRVTFLMPAVNNWGEPDGWEAIVTLPAAVTVKAGEVSDDKSADAMTNTIDVLLRDNSRVSDEQAIEYESQRYLITSFVRDRRERTLAITAEADRGH